MAAETVSEEMAENVPEELAETEIVTIKLEVTSDFVFLVEISTFI